MTICDCYRAERNYAGDIGICYGTKECEACGCGGDQSKCDFYQYLRDRAKSPHTYTLELPVQSGDTVYQLRGKHHARGVGISPRHISGVMVWGDDWAAYHQGNTPCRKSELGKTWFLTEVEAENALKKETG